MSNWLIIPVVLIALVAGTQSRAQTLDELWVEAQDAYSKQDFDKAEAVFTEILQRQPGSVTAMYNLGNCYLERSDLGHAILWYERALRYCPLDNDIRQNLEIANARRENPVVVIRGFFLFRWSRAISNLLSPLGWGLLGVASFGWAMYLLMQMIRSRHVVLRKTILIASGIVFIASVCFGSLRMHEMHRRDQAVVVSGPAQVLIAPDASSKQVTIAGPGEKLVILDSLQQYYKVRLVNFEQGWVPFQDLEKI